MKIGGSEKGGKIENVRQGRETERKREKEKREERKEKREERASIHWLIPPNGWNSQDWHRPKTGPWSFI